MLTAGHAEVTTAKAAAVAVRAVPPPPAGSSGGGDGAGGTGGGDFEGTAVSDGVSKEGGECGEAVRRVADVLSVSSDDCPEIEEGDWLACSFGSSGSWIFEERNAIQSAEAVEGTGERMKPEGVRVAGVEEEVTAGAEGGSIDLLSEASEVGSDRTAGAAVAPCRESSPVVLSSLDVLPPPEVCVGERNGGGMGSAAVAEVVEEKEAGTGAREEEADEVLSVAVEVCPRSWEGEDGPSSQGGSFSESGGRGEGAGSGKLVPADVQAAELHVRIILYQVFFSHGVRFCVANYCRWCAGRIGSYCILFFFVFSCKRQAKLC